MPVGNHSKAINSRTDMFGSGPNRMQGRGSVQWGARNTVDLQSKKRCAWSGLRSVEGKVL